MESADQGSGAGFSLVSWGAWSEAPGRGSGPPSFALGPAAVFFYATLLWDGDAVPTLQGLYLERVTAPGKLLRLLSDRVLRLESKWEHEVFLLRVFSGPGEGLQGAGGCIRAHLLLTNPARCTGGPSLSGARSR